MKQNQLFTDTRSNRISLLLVLIYGAVWFFVQTLTISSFPFVHSDESWLSGLSRYILTTGDIGVTEPFFDTYFRAPHALKVIFHLVQAAAISLFGYSINTVRLVSLICGTGSLLLFFALLRSFRLDPWLALTGMILLSADIEFIYISHFARQEMMLVLILLLITWLTVRKRDGEVSTPYQVMTGALAGLSVGIHPNGALICIMYAVLALFLFPDKKRTLLTSYLSMAVTVLCFLLLSLFINHDFLSTYPAYGETLGVGESVFTKLGRYPDFYRKLFDQVSGTYYTPPVKGQLIIYGTASLAAVLMAIFSRGFRRETLPILSALLAMHGGFILIGRYGQPSVILFLPFSLLLLMLLVQRMKRSVRFDLLLMTVLIILSAVNSFLEIRQVTETDSGYDAYLEEISSAIPDGSVVLGNLNTEYAFEAGELLDWRNLEPAYREGISFSEYVTDREISYIIYPDEIDFIYEHRPVWNVVYGNISLQYEEMQEFLESSCDLVSEFTSPTYAMRIVRFQADEPWSVRIYRVRD